MNFKKDYSKFYNLVYKKKNYKAEVNYILDILNIKNKNIENILELGSGTGAHAAFLAKKGFHITCVEKSKEMIKNFKTNSKRIKIINSDLKKIKLKKKFEIVISMFHVINYMITNKDLKIFFKIASMHLKPGGLLIFDTWFYPAVKYSKPKIAKKTFKYKDFQITRKAVPQQLTKKIFKIKYFVNIQNQINFKNSKFSEIHKIRAFDIKELDKASKRFNLKKLKIMHF